MPTNYHIDFTKSPPEVSLRESLRAEAIPPDQHLRPQQAIINGSTVVYNTIQDKFNALAAEWRRLRAGSSTDDLVDDAYGQIVAMGWPVVPILLREVEKESGHWFTALKWITGHTVVTPEMRGNIPAIREAWLRWGQQFHLQMRIERQKAVGFETTYQTYPSQIATSPASQHGATTVWDSRLETIAGGNTTTATIITGQTASPAAISQLPTSKR